MADPLRNCYIALQSTVDVAPVTWTAIPFNNNEHDMSNRTRSIAEEYGRGFVRATRTLVGQSHDVIVITSHLYYDWHGIPMSAALALPVTANHGAATGVKNHTFKEGAAPPLIAVRFEDGIGWWEMLNCVVTNATWDSPETGFPTATFVIAGNIALPISTPTVVPVSIAAYNHPIDWSQLMMKVAGSAFDIMSATISIDRARTPRFPSRRNVNPKRWIVGPPVVSGSVVPDYTQFSGSLLEDFINNTSPGTIEFEWIDTTTNIGTGTPTNPEYSLMLNNPLLTVSGHNVTEMPVGTPITIVGGNSISAAAAITALLTNEIVSYSAS